MLKVINPPTLICEKSILWRIFLFGTFGRFLSPWSSAWKVASGLREFYTSEITLQKTKEYLQFIHWTADGLIDIKAFVYFSCISVYFLEIFSGRIWAFEHQEILCFNAEKLIAQTSVHLKCTKEISDLIDCLSS